MSHSKLAEKSILTDFCDSIWEPFLSAIERYELISDGDKIAVCISGGKDSMLMAKLIQLFKERGSVSFDTVYLVMDPGYNAENRERIEDNARLLDVPITVFESDIFDIANSTEKSPCYLCARMRRGHLYAKAQQYGCNKIALGHHFNDVIETTLIAMLYGSQIQGMMPKLHSTNFEGMQLIRPMYCIKEADVIKWSEKNDLHFIQCACKFTENSAVNENTSKRRFIKSYIAKLSEQYPEVDKSVFNAVHNLNLDKIIGYKTNGIEYMFNDKE